MNAMLDKSAYSFLKVFGSVLIQSYVASDFLRTRVSEQSVTDVLGTGPHRPAGLQQLVPGTPVCLLPNLLSVQVFLCHAVAFSMYMFSGL